MRAHASGVGALIAVANSPVVLTGGQRQYALPVAHRDQRNFFACQAALDNNAIATRSESPFFEQHIEGSRGFLLVLDDEYPFAGRQSIRFEYDRQAEFLDGLAGLGCRVGHLELGGRNFVAFHELFRKNLAALEFGSRLARTEYRQPAAIELVDDSQRQRHLRANYREIDLEIG